MTYRIQHSLATLALVIGFAAQAQTVQINFDNLGDESGITAPGTSSFEYQESSWGGGVVATMGLPPLYASGSYSYEVLEGAAEVVFAADVDRVEFFYAHGGGVPAGTAEAFDANGNLVGTADSRAMTTFADPDNFVAFDGLIRSVQFTGGSIDNFSYVVGPGGEAFTIDARVEGAWFLPATAGQGFLIDFIDGDPPQLFVAWFTFELPQGDGGGNPYPPKIGSASHRWFTAQGPLADEHTANLNLFQTSGGVFDTQGQVTTEAVGNLTIEFADCNEALVTYGFDDGSAFGEIPLQPVDPGLAGCDQ